MTAARHTPTAPPWRVSHDISRVLVESCHPDYPKATANCGSIGSDIAEANAALIVRAVNAHEALVGCRDALALAVDALKRGEAADAVLICEGRAALALAEGGGK